MDSERRRHLEEADLATVWGLVLGIVFFPDPRETWVDAAIDTVAISTGLGGGIRFLRTAQRHYERKFDES